MRLVKGTIIELNQGEQEVCRLVAKKRFEHNRLNGITNSRRGKQNDEVTDLEGIGGEMAFAKMTNSFIDFSFDPKTQETDTGDVVVQGIKIDVKTTKYNTGKLAIVPWKKCNVDAYVLMVGEFPYYSYRGWCWSEDVLRPENLGDLGYGPSYIVEQAQLL